MLLKHYVCKLMQTYPVFSSHSVLYTGQNEAGLTVNVSSAYSETPSEKTHGEGEKVVTRMQTSVKTKINI